MINFSSQLNLILDFFFPKFCYFCNSTGNYVCLNCRKNLKINLLQKCHVCGKETRLGFVHNECKELTYLDGLLYVTLYSGTIKSLIKDIKYHYYFDILNEIAEIMTNYINAYFFTEVIFTEVPLHWIKKNYRGFNQSELLAKNIAKLTNSVHKSLLIRNHNTKAQASLGWDSRLNNLKNAFELNMDFKNLKLNSKNIIIVDDVFTTGSTLNECAKVLKASGAKTVYGFCFAKSRE